MDITRLDGQLEVFAISKMISSKFQQTYPITSVKHVPWLIAPSQSKLGMLTVVREYWAMFLEEFGKFVRCSMYLCNGYDRVLSMTQSSVSIYLEILNNRDLTIAISDLECDKYRLLVLYHSTVE